MAADEYVFVPGQYGEKITTLVSMPDDYQSGTKPAVILAHGAGNDMFHPLLVHMAHLLENSGYLTVRFNFPFRDRGRRNPDSDEALMASWMSVFSYFRDHPLYQCARIVAAGKSLGGRVALQASAAGLIDPTGLVFFGYPLHPPGKKDILRDAPLHRVQAPMLFFAGSSDPFCDTGILRDVLGRVNAPWSLEVIEGADHSFKVPKDSALTGEQVFARILGVTLHWLENL
ncbi:MAG TPA: dienelactone hydrolase family protein [Deltaproteobacteria bacterium]|nr:dienelactone hydrolase family protein [Deltaproteobacteria bacterium]HOM28506.1 dienelactone hydrolase family protein [Deltaproteobacteria bacterium]HPP80972.1 dienelactone hydrolase family protein [Deltaproteobacteria bacterium]